ncbi:carbohydrate kinase [Ligilactobacillus sp. WILCCON 0076]|uniref:Carbohydrate kinase n=1 Tax=Ligilactobacillus ubinensis TaxID=2876789 RepID=A0A9X2FKZ8_9LACO|nr:FGGY-family carbohydrate kinase [Ligilactobacillus ubinensis]MCP0887477.1 carbohydrate kinase [Ligilactobacillus ubinensis]
MKQYLLTIDNGGTNTKIVIFDSLGNQVAINSFPTKGIEIKTGYHEINLQELKKDLLNGIKQLLESEKIKGEDIVGISTVGHGKGLYLLDKGKQIFTNGILSADNRAEKMAVQFEKNVADIYSMSHQHVMASQAPVILNWFKLNKREVYDNIGYVLSNKDFIRYILTDKVLQEISDASGNNFVDLDRKEYDKKLFQFFNIDEIFYKMPPLVKATDKCGEITERVAAITGLKVGTPVFGGMFDIDACAIATGVLNSNIFSVIAGTWNINTFPCEDKAPLESHLMNSLFPTGKYLVEASSPTSAGNLAIILKMLMGEEMKNASEAGKSIYDDLEEFLINTDARFSNVIFFPFLYGSNADVNAEAAFIGIRSTTTKSELIRAVYEGIAFAHKNHYEKLLTVANKKPEVIRMSGGACNSNAWVQMFSDILDMSIETVTVHELGGLGGAINSAVGLGIYPSLNAAAREMTRVKKKFTPNPKEVKKYQEKYRVYNKLIFSLDDAWKNLNDMQKEAEDNDY